MTALPIPFRSDHYRLVPIPPFLLSAEPFPLLLAQYARNDTMHLVES